MTDKLYDKIGAFTVIPNTVMQMIPVIGPAAFAVFCYLRFRAGSGGNAWPSYDTIGADTGMSRQTIATALDKLEAAGLLQRQKRFNQSTVYTLTLPAAVQKLDGSSLKIRPAVVQKLDANKIQVNKINTVVVAAAPTAPKPDQQPEPIPDRPNIYALYERAIGPLTPALLPHLDAAAETYAPEWVASAFDEAAKNNGRSWSYVRAILEAWQRNGFKVDGRQKQTQTNAPRRGGRKTFAQLKAELEAWAAQGD